MVVCAVFMRLRRYPGACPGARNHSSGALLPESCRLVLCDQPWQPDQVMRRATEDEQPVALLDQPAAAQADGVAGLARGSAVQVAAAALVVVRNVRRHVQLSRGAHKIL